jgi:signal recognition particle receptor subunit beta
MAILDEATQKIVVRIVYDGAVRAGKTTNLLKLCGSLTPLRRSNLLVPGEVSGRTLFFDWLQIEGGVVGGRSLRCQFVTVPGQAVLTRRRRFLLRSADAVVFVCESTPKGIVAGRDVLASLRSFYAASGLEEPPIVIQGNKQDLPGALENRALLAALGLPADSPTVSASAEKGVGIRETAVLAIRAAASRVEKVLLCAGPESLRGSAETAEALHQAMLEVEKRAPLSPVEALNPIVIDVSRSVSSRDDPTTATDEPQAPDPDAPSGAIWPTPRGRETLRSLAGEPLRKRTDLVGRPSASNGSGTSDAFIYQAGKWCLKTSLRRRYLDSVEAKSALLALVRSKLWLQAFLASETVLSLSADRKGVHWLWTVTPWLVTLREQMAHADAASDERALGRALGEFAKTAVASLALAVRSGVAMDVHPSNFARDGGRTVYLDDDIRKGNALPAIGYNLLQRVEEYEHRRSRSKFISRHRGSHTGQSVQRRGGKARAGGRHRARRGAPRLRGARRAG